MHVKNSTKYEIPLFKVPFPPELTVEEILSNRLEDRIKSRAPNRFFIYRLAFLKELRKRTDDNVSMTKISPHISSMWFKETPAVKDTYKNLADQVDNRLAEIRQNEKLVLVSEDISPFDNNNVDFNMPVYFEGTVNVPNYTPILYFNYSSSVDGFNIDHYSNEDNFTNFEQS